MFKRRVPHLSLIPPSAVIRLRPVIMVLPMFFMICNTCVILESLTVVPGMVCLFVGMFLTSQSTTMVISKRVVNLSTFYLGSIRTKRLTSSPGGTAILGHYGWVHSPKYS